MAKELVVSEIRGKINTQLGVLTGNEILVGRDPGGQGIRVNNNAVSRVHGKFVRIRNHWFYNDLGSTNGSWLNGKLVKEGQFKLLRAGDYLQMADTPLTIVNSDGSSQEELDPSGFPAFSRSTLIVFASNQFSDEFPLPEFGRALVVGGSQADLKLDGMSSDVPRLVIERKGEKVVAIVMGEGAQVTLNDQEVGIDQSSGAFELKDSDELKIGHYCILFNDPQALRTLVRVPLDKEVRELPPVSDPGLTQSRTAAFRDWDTGSEHAELGNVSRRASSSRFTFGQSSPESDETEGTMAIDQAEVEARLAGFDQHPSSRYVMPQQPMQGALSSVEDKLMVLVGFVLLLGLMGTVVWWVLR